MTPELIRLLLLNTGVLLLLAMAAGKIVSLLKIPKVTGYLLLGLVLGPAVSGELWPELNEFILNHQIIDNFAVIRELGLALIIFNIGGEFRFEHFKKLGKKVVYVSFFEVIFTFLIVTVLSVFSFYFFFPELSEDIIKYSLILGAVAIATAPAATLLVLREYESQGPVTDYILVLVGLNNILCIVFFKFIFSSTILVAPDYSTPFIEIGLSIGLGVLLGLILSFIEKWLEKPSETLMLVLGGVTFNIGIAYIIGKVFPGIRIETLLSNLFMGVAMINSSTKGSFSFKAVKNADLPLYAIFFILAGTKLHLNELLKGGALFFTYTIGRMLGKYYGSLYGVKHFGLYEKLKNNLSLGLFPQAGVAIGLAILLKENDPLMGKTLATVILSSVMFYELIGPLLTKFSLVRAGEVKEISLSKKNYHKSKRNYQKVLIRLRNAIGFPKRKKSESHVILCKDVMRSSVECIEDSAPFDEVLKFASHCKYDQFPVVDKDNHYLGSISYSEIRDILLDPQFTHLIIASDIMNEKEVIAKPDDNIKDLLFKFHSSGDDLDFLPVISDHDPPHLIGMVTQKDIIAAYHGTGEGS